MILVNLTKVRITPSIYWPDFLVAHVPIHPRVFRFFPFFFAPSFFRRGYISLPAPGGVLFPPRVSLSLAQSSLFPPPPSIFFLPSFSLLLFSPRSDNTRMHVYRVRVRLALLYPHANLCVAWTVRKKKGKKNSAGGTQWIANEKKGLSASIVPKNNRDNYIGAELCRTRTPGT